MLSNEIDISGKLQELDQFIDALPTKEGKLIVVLHKAQELIGFLSREVQEHISRKLNVPRAKVYGVVTFYSYFNMEPKGKYRINCCLGTACFVRGAQDIVDEFSKHLQIKPGETTADMMFSLDALRCVGACGLAPVLFVNDKAYGRLTVNDVNGIIEEYLAKGGNGNE